MFLLTLTCASTAWAVEPIPIPVAATDLEPGTFVEPEDVGRIVVDGEQAAEAGLQDLAIDPAGLLVVQRIYAGEPLRTERLFRPEYTGPIPVVTGMRAVRIPLDPSRTVQGFDYVDVWSGDDCTVLQAAFVLGVEDERGVVRQGPGLVLPQRAAVLLVTEDDLAKVEAARAAGRLGRVEARAEDDFRIREGDACSP